MSCAWPNCRTNVFAELELPTGSGNTQKFCQYHFFIVAGGRFCHDTIRLSGPFKEVELIESVMAARELTKQNQPKTKEEIKQHKK